MISEKMIKRIALETKLSEFTEAISEEIIKYLRSINFSDDFLEMVEENTDTDIEGYLLDYLDTLESKEWYSTIFKSKDENTDEKKKKLVSNTGHTIYIHNSYSNRRELGEKKEIILGNKDGSQ